MIAPAAQLHPHRHLTRAQQQQQHPTSQQSLQLRMGVGGPGVRRVTGLQRQIFHLYRRALLVVASKPVETRSAWYQFVAHHFRHESLGGGLRKQDVGAIEYYLRRGDKMLESYSQDGVKGISAPPDSEYWPEGWAVHRAKGRAVGDDKKYKGKVEGNVSLP